MHAAAQTPVVQETIRARAAKAASRGRRRALMWTKLHRRERPLKPGIHGTACRKIAYTRSCAIFAMRAATLRGTRRVPCAITLFTAPGITSGFPFSSPR